MKHLDKLIIELCKLPKETEWLEFKKNKDDPLMIGKDISALANGAALCEKEKAYLIWGVDDSSHDVVGTTFDYLQKKIGNEELENWLRHQLSPHVSFRFNKAVVEEKTLVVLTINKAVNLPILFQKEGYIRVGTYTKRMVEYPDLQNRLWRQLSRGAFEKEKAIEGLSGTEVINMLDYSIYFDLLNKPIPLNLDGILHILAEDGIIGRRDDGLYDIFNLGAILFAKDLSSFEGLERKKLRVVQYEGINKLSLLKEKTFGFGYASGFENFIDYIFALLPGKEEIISDSIRKKKSVYPEFVIRESLVNALIHQDFYVCGSGPLVEIFDNRMEITNPGKPLIDIMRIVDIPPRSRNEKLASMMRRFGICEELGSGWDRMILSTERDMLPAPRIFVYDESTKVILYSKMPFSSISAEDKMWACYLHACIKYIQGDQLTNSSVRKRFGLEDNASANVSRLIKDCVSRGYLKPLDPYTAPRYMRYIPSWA